MLEKINLLHELFLESAKKNPDNNALLIGENIWTYIELEQAAKRIAGAILNRTNNKCKFVGIYTMKSFVSYTGILGSLFSGAAYVPLSVKFPLDRTLSMINQANLDAIIIDKNAYESFKQVLPHLNKRTVLILPDSKADDVYLEYGNVCDSGDVEKTTGIEDFPVISDDRTAYLLFTSGSTGKPKGVPIAHRNAVSFMKYNLNKYDFTSNDRFTQNFELTFDLSVFDLFMSWGSGGCLCVMREIEMLSPFRWINNNEITVWFSVPSIITLYQKRRSLKPNSMPTLRWSLFCGEALLEKSAQAWQEAAYNSTVENLYGPTELTIACASYKWNKDESSYDCTNGIVPIGNVYEHLKCVVVDDLGNIVEDGEKGELCVAGEQMFSGYLNNEEQTKKCFIMLQNEKYYKTGDIVEKNKFGYTYYGRTDYQVKIQGYRIELGEIEKVIRLLDNVTEAVVIPWPIVDGEIKGMVAFVCGEDLSTNEISEICKKNLTNYMQPSEIHIISDMPHNSNGKIDRNALKNRLHSVDKLVKC